LLNEFKEIPITPALEILTTAWKAGTEQEVETEFNNK